MGLPVIIPGSAVGMGIDGGRYGEEAFSEEAEVPGTVCIDPCILRELAMYSDEERREPISTSDMRWLLL